MSSAQSTLVAAVQMTSVDDPAANLRAAAELLTNAANAGVRLAVLPENFAFMGAQDTAKLAYGEPDGHGPIQDFLSKTAAALGLYVVAGTVPLQVADDPGRVWPACLAYDDHGRRIGRYDKIHLFDVDVAKPGAPDKGVRVERYRESATVARGEPDYVIVPTPAGSMGLSVCYDLRFPELYRGLTQRGAQLLCVPSAFTERTGEAHWEVLLRARAIENQCYVIAPGQSGTHPGGRRTWGRSMIVGSWGEVLACRTDEGPGVVIAEVDLTKLRDIRETFPSLKHRRL